MQLSDHTLRHLPFFEEVASLEEGSDAWHASTAGLVTLRLVDSWLEDGASVTAYDGWNMRSVRATIEKVSERTPVRMLLERIVDALREQKPDIHVVITPMMAYAKILEYDAQWPLAADVYHSVLAHLHPTADSDASIAAHLRLGSCYRSLHQIPPATAAYTAAMEIGNAVGDVMGILRARIGEAQVAVLRGNLPQAEAILEETIRRASALELRDVRSRALHDRSDVAIQRGQYELGIRFAYEALVHSETPTERDRILNDLAGAFAHLGVYSAARDAYLILSATAQEQYIRWAATLNLMEVSSLTGSQVLFEQYRRLLENQSLPPRMAASYELTIGEGYHRFGDVRAARHHLQRAYALAKEYQLNQLLFAVEHSQDATNTASPPPVSMRETPLELKEVATAIKGLREAAGVA